MYYLVNHATEERITPAPNMRLADTLAQTIVRALHLQVRIDDENGNRLRLYTLEWAGPVKKAGNVPYRVPCPGCGNLTRWPRRTMRHKGGEYREAEFCRQCSYPRRRSRRAATSSPGAGNSLIGMVEAARILGMTRKQLWDRVRTGKIVPDDRTSGSDRRRGNAKFRRDRIEAMATDMRDAA